MIQLSNRTLVLLLLVCLFAPAQLQAQNGSTPPNLNGLDGFIEQVMKDWHVPSLAVAIIKDGQMVYSQRFGYRDVKKDLAGGDLKYDESFYATYAMGWMVTSYRGHPALSHGGGIDGFTSHIRFLPKDQLGVVVLTNSSSLEGQKVTFLMNNAGDIDRVALLLEPSVKEIVFTRKPARQQ
jgi:CubicO group peptidase (beta-lactamase class C family)